MLGTPLAKQQPWWITLTLTGMADYPGLPEQPLTVMEMPHWEAPEEFILFK